mmetsp:Transcript_48375/g.89064  ORF Transcript_48375/g.89064 Transcript_48375/m.89064 type:complete len:512 (-) Transcript_48375:325-1860(-)
MSLRLLSCVLLLHLDAAEAGRGLINEIYRAKVPGPGGDANAPNVNIEAWVCGVPPPQNYYSVAVYWNEPGQAFVDEHLWHSSCMKEISPWGTLSQMDFPVHANITSKSGILAIALMDDKRAVVDFPCVDGTITKNGMGTWTATYGPANGLTCILTGFNPKKRFPGKDRKSWSRMDDDQTGAWARVPPTLCEINTGQTFTATGCDGHTTTTTSTTTVGHTSTTTTTTLSVTVVTPSTTTTTGGGTTTTTTTTTVGGSTTTTTTTTAGGATTTTTTTTGGGATTTTTTTTGGGASTTTTTTTTGGATNTTTTTTSQSCGEPYTYDITVIGAPEDPTQLLKEIQADLADAFNESATCVSIVPAGPPQEIARRLTLAERFESFFYFYDGIIGVSGLLNELQVYAIFASLQFQNFVCKGLDDLQYQNCAVRDVEVSNQHIHFVIDVRNDTTTTTTTEMPWGMPWWTWFLVCVGAIGAFCCVCLPWLSVGGAPQLNKELASYRGLDQEDAAADDDAA